MGGGTSGHLDPPDPTGDPRHLRVAPTPHRRAIRVGFGLGLGLGHVDTFAHRCEAPKAPTTPAKLRVRVNHDACKRRGPAHPDARTRGAELVARAADGGREHERGAQHLHST